MGVDEHLTTPSFTVVCGGSNMSNLKTVYGDHIIYKQVQKPVAVLPRYRRLVNTVS